MRWSERQRAMLEEMGIRLWLPPGAAPVDGGEADQGARKAPADVLPAAPGGLAPAVRYAPPLPGPGLPAADSNAGSGAPGLDWSTLAARAAACTACPLCAGRTKSVFGAGHVDADWMVVGDAPDADDDREGEPFAGRAGRLLENMLAAIGLTRSNAPSTRQAYVTHTVKCRPPGQRNPEAAEVARCEPFLLRQVQLVRPRIILAMGRVAAQGLTGSSDAIGKLRGRVHRYAGVPVVVTYHPAYLLRHPQDKADAWADLCLALETLQAPAPA
ncbi:MAG: uracil-DNA glycosylase [Caldimonas sp.]